MAVRSPSSREAWHVLRSPYTCISGILIESMIHIFDGKHKQSKAIIQFEGLCISSSPQNRGKTWNATEAAV
jgi:hypothetical protein